LFADAVFRPRFNDLTGSFRFYKRAVLQKVIESTESKEYTFQIIKYPKSVLDIATGTDIWALEFGNKPTIYRHSPLITFLSTAIPTS
jgi:hypothetical protein